MNIASQLLMKFLFNRIIIFFYFLACIYGQVFAPKAFSLRSGIMRNSIGSTVERRLYLPAASYELPSAVQKHHTQ